MNPVHGRSQRVRNQSQESLILVSGPNQRSETGIRVMDQSKESELDIRFRDPSHGLESKGRGPGEGDAADTDTGTGAVEHAGQAGERRRGDAADTGAHPAGYETAS